MVSNNGSTGMEFLRFGSSIPGSYWGCCAVDIIQNFKCDPDDKASIQIVAGDSGSSIGDTFAGPTYRDIFLQRLRVGTFGGDDMPNHAFIAVLTEWQITGGHGLKWLKILKECGFEFIRTVNNSVYTGKTLGKPTGKNQTNDNHIFMLIRNIGKGGLKDPFTPPKQWQALPSVRKYEMHELIADAFDGAVDGAALMTEQNHKIDTEIWNRIGPAKFLTRQEVITAGAPVVLAGQRSPFPQEFETDRLSKQGGKVTQSLVAPAAWLPVGIPPMAATE
jgi:hypothetical protein